MLREAKGAGEPRDSSETHSMHSLYNPDQPSSNSHLYLSKQYIYRNLPQTRLTISQRKWHLKILAGLVKLCQLSQLTFLCYPTKGKEQQEVMINNGTSRTMLTKMPESP